MSHQSSILNSDFLTPPKKLSKHSSEKPENVSVSELGWKTHVFSQKSSRSSQSPVGIDFWIEFENCNNNKILWENSGKDNTLCCVHRNSLFLSNSI